MGEEQIKERGIQNLQVFYKELFSMAGKQVGEDDEKRDFDKPKDTVKLPETIIKLPRSKPLPKPKPLTKWEKYRAEKGIAPRKKRGRMVFSELTQDSVPRYGKGSEKALKEKSEWAIEEKEDLKGKDPFTLRKQEKKLNKLNEKKKELSNFQNAEKEKVSKSKDMKEKNSDSKIKSFKKVKNERLEKDKKGLSSQLENIQKSTASMGKFDKKIK